MIARSLPDQKRFAFTIIDDTDDAFLDNIRPIYDYLSERRVYITKTVWVYPPRDSASKGDCLSNPDYLRYILELKRRGFEIALHNVGSGAYTREEILRGLEEYRWLIGEYPKIHINHSYNPDNIYGGTMRFAFPFNVILRLLYRRYERSHGDDEQSPYFWGDVHKRIIKFNRNYEFDELNLLKVNPEMPYRDIRYEQCSSYWFSATFAPNQWCFNRIVTPEAVDRLEEEGGICILYTHLGYYMKTGCIDREFIERIDYLASKNTGLYVPVSQVLEHLLSENGRGQYLNTVRRFQLEFRHLWTRFKYRHLSRIDDHTFKQRYP